MATTYRTCPVSGLQFEDQAEKLMRWNAVAGVLWLLVGGITALLVILTRWPAIKLLPADQFYLILTAHGIDMLILWILFFEMAVLYFASSTLLRCRRLAANCCDGRGLCQSTSRRAGRRRASWPSRRAPSSRCGSWRSRRGSWRFGSTW